MRLLFWLVFGSLEARPGPTTVVWDQWYTGREVIERRHVTTLFVMIITCVGAMVGWTIRRDGLRTLRSRQDTSADQTLPPRGVHQISNDDPTSRYLTPKYPHFGLPIAADVKVQPCLTTVRDTDHQRTSMASFHATSLSRVAPRWPVRACLISRRMNPPELFPRCGAHPLSNPEDHSRGPTARRPEGQQWGSAIKGGQK